MDCVGVGGRLEGWKKKMCMCARRSASMRASVHMHMSVCARESGGRWACRVSVEDGCERPVCSQGAVREQVGREEGKRGKVRRK